MRIVITNQKTGFTRQLDRPNSKEGRRAAANEVIHALGLKRGGRRERNT